MRPEKLKMLEEISLKGKPLKLLTEIKVRAELPKSDKLQEHVNNAARKSR